METTPFTFLLALVFVIITGLTVWLFFRAANRSVHTLLMLLVWLLVQGVVGLSGFYTVTNTLPPRLLLVLGPPIVAIVVLFATARGRQFLDALRPELLTLVHVARIPVELVLLGLFLQGAVPQVMTFEGRNMDVLSGLTAPVVYVLAYRRKLLGLNGRLLWNMVCLGLLFNIVGTAILAAPTPLQRLAFEQPNVAILHFPFVWLPGCVVPLVLLAHLATIRQLLAQKKNRQSNTLALEVKSATLA